MTTYAMADLFAGIGGFHQAANANGVDVVWANDILDSSKIIYEHNYADTVFDSRPLEDIPVDDIPDVDIITGGFPCQPFSVAGNRKGFEDPRGELFFRVMDVVRAKNPQVVFLENVKNLTTHNNGETMDVIESLLADEGYTVSWKVLSSIKHGNIPQKRERVFIVAFLDPDAAERFEFPDEVDLTIGVRDLTDDIVPEKYHYNGKPLYARVVDDITDDDTVYQWRRKYVRALAGGTCPTLTAAMGGGGHNVPIIKRGSIIRKLTPRECFRLQGFPDSFEFPEKMSDTKLYHMAGNSVTVPVVSRVMGNIMKALTPPAAGDGPSPTTWTTPTARR